MKDRGVLGSMKLSSKKIVKRLSFLVIVFVLVIFCLINAYVKNNINYVLESKSYSYLPLEAKNYIKDVYNKTGEIVLTEKNKKENEPYLNPKYIEYLKLSDEEKGNVELIPDVYVLDYEVSNSYSTPTLPSSYDLRDIEGKNYVSSVKNQGSTGICWAFASIENVETFLMKQNGQSFSDKTPKFSIRQMDYATATDYLVRDASWISCSGNCSWKTWGNSDNGSRKLGEGGNFFTSSIIMSNGLSLTDESVLPWTEENNPKWPKDIMGYDKSLYEVNSTIQMPIINENDVSEEVIDSYVSDVKNYIMKYGGPFVGTYSPKSTCGFSNIDGTKAIKTDDCVNNSLNKDQGHAMQIIGWDDDYEYAYCDAGEKHYPVKNNSCSLGQLTQGKGAWILRNSWGDDTDEASEYKYVYLTYDSTRLSIGFTTSISEMENRTWDNNYHSNPWIDRKLSNGMASVTNQIDEFDTNNIKSEKIEKIKFLTASKTGNYNLSIISGDKQYNNAATITSNEVGVYTVDLSSKNIVLNNNKFSVKIESTDGSKFYNDSISVFTSNVDKDSYAITYSSKAYDDSRPLSDDNPLYIDLYHNIYHDIYSWDVTMNSYLKNLPQYAELSYRLRKNDVVANYFGERNIHYEGDIATAEFEGESNNFNVNFSIRDELGETWTMEIVYKDEVINSFPIKFNTDSKKTKSNVRLHANNGTDYYYDYSATDRGISKFKDLDGNADFYNNGYYIKSWNTKADGTGISYNVDDGVLVYHDMELYAQWSTEKLNVEVVYKGQESYCSNCIKGTMESEYYGYDDIIEFPINKFTKDNYVFKEWEIKIGSNDWLHYEQDKMSQKVSDILKNSVFNNTKIMVYGTWTDNYVTISFDANGGTGTMTSINIEPHPRSWSNGDYNEDVIKNNKIKNNLFTKAGYIFTGWNTKADGTGTSYRDGQWVKFSESQTLYAQWEAESKYIITFYANDGTINFTTQGIPDAIITKLNKNTFTRTGYTFTGWNTKADGTGTSYTDEYQMMISNNLVVYAQWEANKYTVTFNSNGGLGKMIPQLVSYNVSTKLSKNTFTKAGFKFTGWNTKADGTGAFYTNEQLVSLTDNITLYAQWGEGDPYVIHEYHYDENNNYISNIGINTLVEDYKRNIELLDGYTIDVEYKTIDSKKVLYTGGKTKIYRGQNIYAELTNAVSGDTNGDGKINYLDYVNVYNHIQKTKHPETSKKLLVNEYLLAADISGDGNVTYLDYVKIYNKIKELKEVAN